MNTGAPMLLSLQAMDETLLAAWQRFRDLMEPGHPLSAVQQRFAAHGLFPQPVWSWLAGGEALALQQADVAVLHGTLGRVLACAHACWGRPDAEGLHHGGEDHSAAVTPALHALALGPGYVAEMFHAGRPLSTQGYPPRRHAANLLVLLHHPDWAHAAKALQQARAYVDGKGGSQADRAFVATLLALATADAGLLRQALPQFAAGYLRSDWGRHLPQRQPVVVANLLALARRHLPQAVDAALAAALLAPDRLTLWQAHAQTLAEDRLPVHAWGGELAFLDGVPGLHASV